MTPPADDGNPITGGHLLARALMPVTKFSETVTSTERVAEMVSTAFRACYSGAPGPSYLEIPVDVLRRSIDPAAARVPACGRYRASTRSLGDPKDIDSLVGLLTKAQRPCVLLGSQVMTCRAGDIAVDFCRRLNVPAYVSGAARGCFSPGDPHSFHHTRRQALHGADVVMIVGLPLDYRMSYGRHLPPETSVVQINLDYGTVGLNRDFSLGIVGDAGMVLQAVLDASGNAEVAPARARGRWMAELRELERQAVETQLPKLRSDEAPIHPLRLASEINDFLTGDSIFIGDGGDVVTFSGGVIQPKAPGQWMDTGPLGTLGIGTPFAMAAKLAYPQKEVVCLFGDGSFALTGWDFESCARHGLPFIGVIGNNSHMNQVRYGTRLHLGQRYGEVATKLSDVNYSDFAKMLGGYGEEVHDAKEIQRALWRARASGQCALIDVWIDPEAFSPGTIHQTMYQ